MRIAVAGDHAGYRYKEAIKRFLAEEGHDVQDFGTDSGLPVDYPLFIRPAALAVARGDCGRAIAAGGSALRPRPSGTALSVRTSGLS